MEMQAAGRTWGSPGSFSKQRRRNEVNEEIRSKASSASYPARPPPSSGPQVLKTLVEQLPVPLTQEQRLQAGLELAQQEGALLDQEALAQTTKADLKAKEAQIRALIARLSTEIRNGHRLADVSVSLIADFETNLVRYTREDTGEVVRTRALDASERQTLLGFEEQSKDAPTKPDLPSGVSRAEPEDEG